MGRRSDISIDSVLSDVNEFPAAVTNPPITKLALDRSGPSDRPRKSRTRVAGRHKSRKLGPETGAGRGWAKKPDGGGNGRLTCSVLCLCAIRRDCEHLVHPFLRE